MGLKCKSTASVPPLKGVDGSMCSNAKAQTDLLANTFTSNMLLNHNWVSSEQEVVEESLQQLDNSPFSVTKLVRPHQSTRHHQSPY
jgi:hypothetical protein